MTWVSKKNTLTLFSSISLTLFLYLSPLLFHLLLTNESMNQSSYTQIKYNIEPNSVARERWNSFYFPALTSLHFAYYDFHDMVFFLMVKCSHKPWQLFYIEKFPKRSRWIDLLIMIFMICLASNWKLKSHFMTNFHGHLKIMVRLFSLFLSNNSYLYAIQYTSLNLIHVCNWVAHTIYLFQW